ncbi:hypothetical protein F0562_017049 [Nyssa sinensis]|uniref:Fe2OG dioxygenase domain-containing protein n=1 Tax=Nyssa sinensis TaxID=561372 RepID=A0A5J4ZDS8_9ASTE|nr:hypothetical protein F0562_017049 [Nyssa sinensis]
MAVVNETVSFDQMKDAKEFDNFKIGVKGLADSGIATIPSFFVQPPEILSDLKSFSSTCTGIPIIDLSDVNSDLHRPKIVEQIREAARTCGFFQVINHGVPVSVLDETIAAIKGFHEQPPEVKAEKYSREEGQSVMYASNYDMYRAKVAASWYDSLQVWMAPEAPKGEDIPEMCRKEVLQWDMHAKKVADTVLELLSEGLGLERGKFKELGFSDSRLFMGHCYPFCPQPDLTIGIRSHSDYAIMAVLLQNQVPGLQIKHGDGWVDVKPLHGGLIINIGDSLQIISNDEYKSVEHRVLANSSKEPRISTVEFFHADNRNGSACFGPLPELLSPEKPAIYRNFTMKEFLEIFYTKGVHSKSLVKELKL